MKILHLEDTPADAELTHVSLREEWPDCEIEVVGGRDGFASALALPRDVILSDFNIPGFSGLEALKLARERAAGVPFLFFSGTIGEDRAIEALRCGACDYVIKDRPKRLIPAIKRVIEAARHARERKAIEEQMLRVQRLENLGMLAAGIAHDFNNVLAPVMMGIPLVRRQLGSLPILDTMERSAARGAGLVKQIVGFAHGVTGEAQIVQPGHVLREVLGVIQQTFPKNIRLRDAVGESLWPVKANPTHLHQVVLNLCVNARDAMPEGGTLTVRAANVTLDPPTAATLPGSRAGSHVMIEIADTGTGIAPEILGKIWDPFFTTKGPGKGTGLGLATVRAIVSENGGTINLRSKVGEGSSFEIMLPAEPTMLGEAVSGTGADAPDGNGELILVVDDDAPVREVTCATLTQHGYRVIAAADGTEAVALAAPRNLEIRALITDIDLPNLDGTALTKVVAALNPSIRVILMSGSSSSGEDLRRRPPPHGRFLAKPFAGSVLLQTLHEVLAPAAVLAAPASGMTKFP